MSPTANLIVSIIWFGAASLWAFLFFFEEPTILRAIVGIIDLTLGFVWFNNYREEIRKKKNEHHS